MRLQMDMRICRATKVSSISRVTHCRMTMTRNTAERRKTWIYDVPLQYTHRLRNMINSSASALPVGEMRKFDLPVIASTVKLWLLELAVAIVPSPMYNDVKGAYPSGRFQDVVRER